MLPDLLTQVKPDLVMYDAGVDPHTNDALGRLALSSNGLFRRDMQVFHANDVGAPVHACGLNHGQGKPCSDSLQRQNLQAHGCLNDGEFQNISIIAARAVQSLQNPDNEPLLIACAT